MFANSYRFVISKFVTKTTLILISIILIGAFLRFYDFSDLLRFNADQVRDAQIIDGMRDGEFPLLGPKAGGTKFNLGPAFYYLEYLSGVFFGFTPSGIAFFIPLLSTISIYLFYLLFKKIFSTNITLTLTFLYAISFYALKYSHFAWNPNAIPFFVLAFLLLLERIIKYSNEDATNRVSMYRDFIFLGIIIGVGIQLHTTLLILMPLFTVLIFFYLFFKKEKISLGKIFVLLAVIILFNTPFIYEAFSNNGKNIQDFIVGTQTKTESDSNIINNIFHTSQFFLQGGAYHLSGIEPQKNWLNIVKLLKSKNIAEITLFLISLIIFISGLCLILKQKYLIRNKETLYLLLSFTALSFLFLVPLGVELNLRFFIILQFVPYLLLGLIMQALLNLPYKKTLIVFIVLFIVTASFFNLLNYKKTYNLDNYTAPESSYGGISLGELTELCVNLNELAAEDNSKEIYVENFEFKRSLEYVCAKNNVALKFLSEEKITDQKTFFVIAKNENMDKNTEKYKESFELKNSITIKRFVLLTFNRNK